MSLITQDTLKSIPGILTSSLSNITSVIQSLSNLQAVNPAAFAQFQSQISSLLSGFDAASNLLNSVGGFAQGLQDLATTPLSPSTIQDLADSVNNIANQIDNVNTLSNIPGRTVQSNRTSVQSSTRNQQTSIYKYPSNLGKYWFGFGFSQYYFSSKFGGFGGGYPVISSAPSNLILMPLPVNLTDQFQIAFSEFKPGEEVKNVLLGAIRGAVQPFTGGTTPNREASPGLGAPTTGGMGGRAAIGMAAAGALAGALSSGLSTAAKIGMASAGVAINPATTLLLEGPMLKDHVFKWRLSPSSEQESKVLNDIVKRIKLDISPGLGYSGLLLDYPKIINCYMYNAEKMYFYKPAMVTSFAVDYTPSGPAFFKSPNDDTKGGYPVELEITMVIKELEAWLSSDFAN